jgi:hypothetical protein
VAAIDRAFGDPAPARGSDRGPRDVRRGDQWLPWHFQENALCNAFEDEGVPFPESERRAYDEVKSEMEEL